MPFEYQKFSSGASITDWDNYPPVSTNETNSDIKNVSIFGNTIPIKGMLLSSGYKYHPRRNYDDCSWSRQINFRGKNLDEYFKETTWSKLSDGVRIVISSEAGIFEKELKIWNGKIN